MAEAKPKAIHKASQSLTYKAVICLVRVGNLSMIVCMSKCMHGMLTVRLGIDSASATTGETQ